MLGMTQLNDSAPAFHCLGRLLEHCWMAAHQTGMVQTHWVGLLHSGTGKEWQLPHDLLLTRL